MREEGNEAGVKRGERVVDVVIDVVRGWDFL